MFHTCYQAVNDIQYVVTLNAVLKAKDNGKPFQIALTPVSEY